VDEQRKRFIVENRHCRPKGPFIKDKDKYFSEKCYCTVSKSGLKIEKVSGYVIHRRFKRLPLNFYRALDIITK
jgi:hypothetical protein